MNIENEMVQLYNLLTPPNLRNRLLTKNTKKDWKDGYQRLFMFTAGLYFGSKFNEKTIKKLLKIKD